MIPNRKDLMRLLKKTGFVVQSLNLGLTGDPTIVRPHLVVDRGSYPGAEAHLFTAADAAMWKSEQTANGNILLYFAESAPPDGDAVPDRARREEAWKRLAETLERMGSHLEACRAELSTGHFSTLVWGHHDGEWFRRNREAPWHTLRPPREFIEYVDFSIRPQITQLNQLGFATLECCSGLARDHPDRDAWWPYIMFDERVYPGATPHLFTLGDMAGWITTYARYNFDVAMKVRKGQDVESSWNRLVDEARYLATLLHDYRLSVDYDPEEVLGRQVQG